MKNTLFSIGIIVALSSPFIRADDITVSRIVSVYDGDTIKVDIDSWPEVVGKGISVRVRGVDTPEIRGKCDSEKALAIRARDYVRNLLTGESVVKLRNVERGKYFRLVADVYSGDLLISQQLITRGYGRPYDGQSSRGTWCH